MIRIKIKMPIDCMHCRFLDDSLDCRASANPDGTVYYHQFHCEPTNVRQTFCPLAEDNSEELESKIEKICLKAENMIFVLK